MGYDGVSIQKCEWRFDVSQNLICLVWSPWSVGVYFKFCFIPLSACTCLGTHHITFKTYSKQQRSNKLLLLIRSLLSTWFWVSFWGLLSSCSQFFRKLLSKLKNVLSFALYPSLFESGPPNFFERPLQNIQNLYIFELSVPGVYAFTLHIRSSALSRRKKCVTPGAEGGWRVCPSQNLKIDPLRDLNLTLKMSPNSKVLARILCFCTP